MEGYKTADESRGDFFNPTHAANLAKVKEVAALERKLALRVLESHPAVRVQTVSMRLLLRHAEYCELFADMMEQKALGNEAEANRLWKKFRDQFGSHEFELERYYDHYMAMQAMAAYIDTEDLTEIPGLDY